LSIIAYLRRMERLTNLGGGTNMAKLDNKVAVITGSSSGIGLAIARRFVAEGAFVYLTGRRQAELDAACATLGGGDRARAVRGDAGSSEDLDRLYETIRAEKGRLDVVVANAGVNEAATLADTTPEQLDRVFGLNTRAVVFTVQKALPLLADGGAVVVVGSATHARGLPGIGAYAASKAAVRSFARTWAAELKERGIRVNCLSPGAVDTPFLVGGDAVSKDDGDRLRAQYSTWIPLGRIGRTEEIAAAAAYLASSESSYVTGADLVVDGGFTQL
jgi:NAD(P)-dependent dehydrogenase (short-subunit alcohol dehydrogenase family)